jgi:arsenate reductase
MKGLTLYAHPTCTTCEGARKWLEARGVDYIEKDIRATPPTLAELRAMLQGQGGELKRLCNTSGIEYRAQGLSAKLPGMATDEALRLLSGNGMLVKRPFLLGPGVALVGFKESVWAGALPSR